MNADKTPLAWRKFTRKGLRHGTGLGPRLGGLILLASLSCTSCEKKAESRSEKAEVPYAEGRIEDTVKPTFKEEEAASPLPVATEQRAFTANTPSTMIEALVESLKQGNYQQFLEQMGHSALNAEQEAFLKPLLNQSDPVLRWREVGELQINEKSRWALQLGDDSREVFIDFRKQASGQWQIDRITIPPPLGDPALSTSQADGTVDSLTLCDQFVRALVQQDFEQALRYIDKETVSNTTIAALCIIFEEGQYTLRERKPLRSLFQRETAAGFMANVLDATGVQNGQFSITLQRAHSEASWQVTEINLDALISRYVEQVAEGDSYYTPLVQKLEGGNTLALYFEFNKDALTPRSKRQLEIVAKVLRADRTKKLTLSGHTDSLGSDSYNQVLSEERAQSVKRFLVSQKIPAEQIQILAFGESQPRRDNNTDQGRRVNRRTEIYLDF